MHNAGRAAAGFVACPALTGCCSRIAHAAQKDHCSARLVPGQFSLTGRPGVAPRDVDAR
jgi:hypothetical protein